MKTTLRLLSSIVFVSLVACGTDPSAFNASELLESEHVSEESPVESQEELGLDRDACALKADQLTFRLAAGGSLQLSYKFFWFTAGDRVRVKNAETGAVVYDSSKLSQAEGVLSIPVSQLGVGRFIAEGFINTYLPTQDAAADCKVGSRIVIRNR